MITLVIAIRLSGCHFSGQAPDGAPPVPGPTGRPEVILQDAFTVEPWNLRETHLDLDLLAQTESVFALANGHVGWRANLDEG